MVRQMIRQTTAVFLTLAHVSVATQSWTYEYLDDFTSDQATQDAFFSSRFWPEGAHPPSEPCLQYNGLGHDRYLTFIGCQGRPAYLGYRFPVDGFIPPGPIRGTVSVEVLYPGNGPGGLAYSVSSDGYAWSRPVALLKGRHVLEVHSIQGSCYVLFLGNQASINNLTVHLVVPSATITVPGDCNTIQQAIDLAKDGDVIEVAPGIYKGPGNTDIQMRGKSVTLRSAAGPDKTIIVCRDPVASSTTDQRGFYIHEGEGPLCILQGFTLQSGSATGGDSLPGETSKWTPSALYPMGGGIFCENTSPTIVNCRIVGCSALLGAGIGCAGGGPVIAHCVIEDCTIGRGTSDSIVGMGAGIALIRQSDVRLSHCVIKDNTGLLNGLGGGLYIRSSQVHARDCDIVSNGGATLAAGGGLYMTGPASEAILQNCLIAGNAAKAGTGIYALRNAAEAENASALKECILQVLNCTIADNQVMVSIEDTTRIGAIDVMGCRVVVKNSIVWPHQGQSLLLPGLSGESDVTYCDIRGGYPGAGNIQTDPLFASAESGDYHLQSRSGRYDPLSDTWVIDSVHSPCIDAGDPEDPFGYEPFPNGRRINMGAYGGTEQASKSQACLIYHVDASTGNDIHPGLSRTEAFATIQRGLDTAKDGDVVMVWPGFYKEEVDFLGKAVMVQSAGGAAVVTAPQGCAFSFYHGEGPASVLRNLVIRGSQYAVFCSGTGPTLTHLTLVGNDFGIVAYDGAAPLISSSIFWKNTLGDLFQCKASYSRLGLDMAAISKGNIPTDPLFADPDQGDYHLRSLQGRYSPLVDLWVADRTMSPCIDAGDPDVDPAGETWPNGGRIDMGALGGTSHASLSECPAKSAWNRDLDRSFEGTDLQGWLTRPVP
jgi:hypothetical protein